MGRRNSGTECIGCIYSCQVHETLTVCDYYMITKKRRPCPPGKACTVMIDKEGFKRRTTPVDRDEVIRLAQTEIGTKAIAEAVGCSRIYVCKILQEWRKTQQAANV